MHVIFIKIGDENKKGTTSLDSPVQILHSLDDKQTKM